MFIFPFRLAREEDSTAEKYAELIEMEFCAGELKGSVFIVCGFRRCSRYADDEADAVLWLCEIEMINHILLYDR